jgi:hypothetical protein
VKYWWRGDILRESVSKRERERERESERKRERERESGIEREKENKNWIVQRPVATKTRGVQGEQKVCERWGGVFSHKLLIKSVQILKYSLFN